MKTLHALQDALHKFVDECLNAGHEVLMEADAVGWVFHALLTQPGVDPRQLHLEAHVNAEGLERARFDIALGHVKWMPGEKPFIQARLVAELKLFPKKGASSQQHRRHYVSVLEDDLPKLGGLTRGKAHTVMLLVDGQNYLGGYYRKEVRREVLVRKRNQVAPNTHLFIVHQEEGGWRMHHLPPA